MNARIGDLSARGPLGLKPAKAKPRPDYLAAVRGLPCCICMAFDEGPQQGPSHAHHVIMGRYGQRKTPDIQSIPLCWTHHQGAQGIHTRPALWREQYGPDTDYTAATQDALAHLLED